MEVGLQTIISYLRDKQKLIINAHYRYDMRHVVMSLNNSCIDNIKQEFQYNNNKLDLDKFLWLMRQALDQQDQSSNFICYELVKLFQEIDIDSSNTIEWSQFLQYLSQSNWLSTPVITKNHLNARDSNVLVHAFHQEAKYRKHTIKKIIELPRHNSLGLLATNNSLSFLNLNRSQQNLFDQSTQQSSQKSNFTLNYVDPNRILSIDYSEQERLFGILLTNRNLCFVEDGQMQKNHGVLRSSGSEVQIRYLQLHRLWVIQSVNSTLQVFQSPKSSALKDKIVFRPHEEPITAIREVASPLSLCTASLDGIIKLWNIGSGKLIIQLDIRKQRNGEQKKGVKGIATYNRGLITYICAWMFTTEIFLWLPSLSLSKPYAGDLHGHLGLITDCTFAWRGELISIDDKRAVRVWNPQKLQCIQSFTIGQQNCSLIVLKSQPYLITYSRLLNFYRIRTNSKADLQSQVGCAGKDGKNVLALGGGQSNKLIAIQFSSYYCFLIVITSQQIKIMDVNNTNLIVSIRPPPSYEFISATMKSSRRICIGVTNGTIHQYKIQDGQLVRCIQLFLVAQEELKFTYYHQDTKILMSIIEDQFTSKLVTYDLLNVEESTKIKEIQFEQINLIDFKALIQTNRFFILSFNGVITVWNYDKLIILNRIELQNIASQILLGTLHLITQPINQCILVQSGKGVCIIHFDTSGSVSQVKILQFGLQDDEEGTIVSASLLLQKISVNYIQQQKNKKTKRQLQFQQKKKVQFQIYNEQKQQKVVNDKFQEMFIFAVANKKGQIYYYSLHQILSSINYEQIFHFKGKMQRVKQNRKAHMKPFLTNGKISTFNCFNYKFTEEYSLIPNVQYSGSILGTFYFHTKENLLYFFNSYTQIKAEWTLSLPKPKNWNIYYNQINQILLRLDKTQKALENIYQLNSNRFKAEFLMTKYLTEDQIDQLKKIEKRTKKDFKSSLFFSYKQPESKKSIISINDKLSSGMLKEKAQMKHRPINPMQKKNAQNIFDKKLQETQKKRMIRIHSKDLFQKVQKSLSYSKLNQANAKQLQDAKPVQKIQKIQKSAFVIQMDNMLNSVLKNSQPIIENSSVKSMKKDRRPSATHLSSSSPQEIQQIRSRSSGLKSRIKSSIAQLSKNFTSSKIQLHNFRKTIGQGLLKRGKLKL